MDIKRINFLRSELEAERISYGELAEIQEAFEQLDPATLRDLPENAMAGDMLEELESAAHSRMAPKRIAHTLKRLELWASNFDANAESARKAGRQGKALELTIRANEIRDIIKMLDGTEDDYIVSLSKRAVPDPKPADAPVTESMGKKWCPECDCELVTSGGHLHHFLGERNGCPWTD